MAGASATRAVIVALLVAHIASLVCSVTGWAGVIDVDPEVRTLVNAGRARVLVTLLVADSGDEALRATAIGRAQDAVLSRLPRPFPCSRWRSTRPPFSPWSGCLTSSRR